LRSRVGFTVAGASYRCAAGTRILKESTITTTVSGHLIGLKPAQKHALERIYRRTVPPNEVITSELATFMAGISAELNRQVGVIINRRGRIEHVVLGDAERLFLPDLGRTRAGQSRFRGVRLVHTHVSGERLSKDDLTDLAKLHLDLIGVVQATRDGLPPTLELAHLTPIGSDGEAWHVQPPVPLHRLELDFQRFVEELEGRFAESRAVHETKAGDTRAIVVHVTRDHPTAAAVQWSLDELAELCRTAGVAIVETIVQRRPQPDPKYVVGKGKLTELALSALHHDADLVVFDRDLTPSQARAIADAVELRVIDRTQLILDIFAQRARSLDGKLQVELAQLRYALPRLAGKGTSMSRLMGGIGGRGPGESKLETDRRRAKDRISNLQQKIDDLGRQRAQRRARRGQSQIPIAAIVGYTNAGKSTLMNTLTGATVMAEDKLFATLDPTARRLVIPDTEGHVREVIVTDTVGFIRDLPDDLMTAFKATLEELGEADVLIHVVDISQDGWEERMGAVNLVLKEREVHETPTIMVFNKVDRLEADAIVRGITRRFGALAVSALDRTTLLPLVERLAAFDQRGAGGVPGVGAGDGVG